MTEQRATITIEIDHPAVFLEDDVYTFQGECPVATAGSEHQTYITVGRSVCPGCGATFDARLWPESTQPEALIVRW